MSVSYYSPAPAPAPGERTQVREIHRAIDLVREQRKKARLSMNRRRVKPRSAAQVIVDDMWTHPYRDYYRHVIYIYFIRRGEYVKIGRSDAGVGRMADLQQASPEPLELMGTFTGIPCDEQMLHYAFAEHRIRGEWFTHVPLMDEVLKLLQPKP